MTREDAAIMAKAFLKCLERESSGVDPMCNCDKCDDCDLNYEKGNVGEIKEWLRIAIKALEQEYCTKQNYITGKINGVYGVFLQCIPKDEILDELLDTIDKEKAESEGKTIEENGNM